MGALLTGCCGDPEAGKLLRAVLIELRALRTALERAGLVNFGADHDALLAAVHSTVGETKWTCSELIHLAFTGAGAEAAALRQILAALRLADPLELGLYLRQRVGPTGEGLELRRIGLTVNKVVRWCVTCV